MEIIFTVLIILAVVVTVGPVLFGGGNTSRKKREKPKYRYQKQKFFMTKTEHECYKVLSKILGDRFYLFAQVHLSTIVDHKVKGQSWKGAFSHINQKSVDFVVCSKDYISPVLAIELDDSTHGRPDRQRRDVEVERILEDAGVPLLRIENRERFNSEELERKIKNKLF
jgi:very-short-patch-repair endonuclease